MSDYSSKIRCYGVSHYDITHKDTSDNYVTHSVISHNVTLVIKEVSHNTKRAQRLLCHDRACSTPFDSEREGKIRFLSLKRKNDFDRQ